MSDYLNSTQNLVHPDWEVIDPTPDIHTLFPIFDRKFFQGRLVCVQLEWSKRMYSCAGICYQRSNRMGKSCIIRLSEPLLKLRSRKDLVETLLHEMIHAYCFVLGIREGNGGHGPHFKKIMFGINKIAGTNITVYHTFHDEVSLYKTHWWQCRGPCRSRGPYYGMVKRSANRKPGPSDFWWAEHQRSCGGEYVKVKEPEPKRKKAANKENEPRAVLGSQIGKKTGSPVKGPGVNRINNYFGTTMTGKSGGTPPNGFKKPPYTGGGSGTMANVGGRTMVIRPTTSTRKPPAAATTPQESVPAVKKPSPVVPPGGNLKNVKQFKDLGGGGSPGPSPVRKPATPLFAGSGRSLGGAAGPSRVGQPGNARNSRLLDQFPPSQEKKPRISESGSVPESIDLSDDTDYVFDQIDLEKIKQERQDSIRKEILESLDDSDLEDIVLIDDEYDDDDAEAAVTLDGSLTDTSVIDELFSDNDALIEEFKQNNSVSGTGSGKSAPRFEDEIVSCPMCLKKIKRSEVAPHLERCYSLLMGEEVEDDVKTVEVKKEPFDPNKPSTSKAGTASSSSATTNKKPSPKPSSSKAGTGSSSFSETTKKPSPKPATSKAGTGSSSSSTPVSKKPSSKPATSSSSSATRDEQRQLLLDCGYSEADISAALAAMESEEESEPAPAPAIATAANTSTASADASLLLMEDDVEEIDLTALVEECECPVCSRKIPFEQINRHLDTCLGA